MKNLNLQNLIKNKFGDKYFPDVNHLTFDKLPAETLYQRDFGVLFEQDAYLFIIVGTDSGLFYNFVKDKTQDSNNEFLFIDYDEVIGAADNLKSADWNSTPKLVDQNFNFEKLNVDFKHYMLSRKVMLIKSYAVLDAEKDGIYDRLWHKIETSFNQFTRSEFNSQSAKVFEIERIYNAPDNLIPAKVLDKSLEGCDAIVLGGGPTLDESIEWIKNNQSKLIIFAAARIANRMAYEGITPDFFVSVDPFPWSFDNAKGVLAFHDRSVFITSFHAQHRLVSQWRGAHFFAGERYAWKHDGRINNFDAPGPTVTNSALHMAFLFGAKRIFLSGVDFCFAGGKTHESLSDEAQANDLYAYQTKMKLEDNLGNQTESEPAFFWAKHSMEEAIRTYKRAKDVEFFSLGSLSAKMDGVSYVPAHEVSLGLADKSSFMLPVFEKCQVTPEQRLQHLNDTAAEFKKQFNRFNKLQRLAADALKTIPKVYDKKTMQLKAKPAGRVSKLKHKATHLIGDDGDMLLNYQAIFFADSFKKVVDEKNMTNEEVVEQLTAFFKGVELSSRHFAEAIESGLDRVKSRIKENECATVCELLEVWRKNSETGRAYIWQANNLNQELDETQQACLQKAIDEYESEFSKKDHQYSQMLADGVSNVATLYQRADEAYRTRNLTELRGLYDHASSMDAKDESQKNSFVTFIKAMIEELDGDIEDAIDFYLQVEMPFFRRISLNKVLNIKIKQQKYDEALLVLENLCGYSLDFMLPYADMLNMLGNRAAAIEVLGMFINQKPKAIDARIKLAQWQIEASEFEQAKQTLNKVLDLNPENKAAAHLLMLVNE
ncbi:DUF115 domain-containing protein [Thiomicrospira microaerophila]|uniref:6-hydroxymethylpterin diphosphokinase MptE-like protein n=1 Tax=Thiomicrospira microaerophila TaxID=406020 RepID=UPI00200FEC2F|nr:6-hydroxymethylpterin diphosphokinase MptE-like protein [Thiomicrospira microaerophila]UQB42713.1 DUF115 domain-containing protein [Thiomicrospira microaerophila]